MAFKEIQWLFHVGQVIRIKKVPQNKLCRTSSTINFMFFFYCYDFTVFHSKLFWTFRILLESETLN